MALMNKAERDALHEKMNNPAKTVKCLRCGNEIIIVEYPTAIEYKCKTPNCIKMGLRGI